MNFNEYMKGVRNCPDKVLVIDREKIHKLDHDFGVCDNWTILLTGISYDMLTHFKADEKYRHLKTSRNEFILEYDNGIAEIYVSNGIKIMNYDLLKKDMQERLMK